MARKSAPLQKRIIQYPNSTVRKSVAKGDYISIRLTSAHPKLNGRGDTFTVCCKLTEGKGKACLDYVSAATQRQLTVRHTYLCRSTDRGNQCLCRQYDNVRLEYASSLRGMDSSPRHTFRLIAIRSTKGDINFWVLCIVIMGGRF